MKNNLLNLFSVVLILFLTIVLIGCYNEDYLGSTNTEKTNQIENIKPETQVFFQGLKLEAASGTRAAYKWPQAPGDGFDYASFSIRADGQIQDYLDKNPALYYGTTKGKNNKGKVSNIYPYGRYNDRDLDYTKKDKKTGENIGLFRYVYDPNGLRTQLAIVEAPLIQDIVNEDIAKREAEIAKGNNVAKNTAELEKLIAMREKGDDYLNSHVLWYTVKEVGFQYGWHVDGVFVDYEMPDFTISPDKVPDNVEVDIHQQEHTDWNQIKTSIHIRTDAESVTINMPIDYDNIIEKDDFDIRVFESYYQDYVIKHEITHNSNGITIRIYDIPATLIQELRNNYGDGITVEVYSYTKKQDGVWDALKNSWVINTGKPCTVNGQISNAFNDEVVPISVKNP